MRELFPLVFVLSLTACTVFGVAGDAAAQDMDDEYMPGLDISGTYGWMWGGNADAINVPTTDGLQAGKFRWGSSQSYMISIERPIAPWIETQFSYTMQPSQLNWAGAGYPETKVCDMTMNYWQIGTTAGIPSGRVMPFTTFTLGINYWKFYNFNDTIYTIDNQSKFAITAGLGAKTYFGENQRVGVRVQFRVLPTWYNNIVTTNGGNISVSGHIIWQWEVAAGLSVKLGV